MKIIINFERCWTSMVIGFVSATILLYFGLTKYVLKQVQN